MTKEPITYRDWQMLTTWRLCRFKSVIDETTLPLAGLTIFTGANSAGKSTVIQSMLLTAQSLQSSNLDRPVVLNGHIARLGSFRDLVSSADTKEAITIGFRISPNVSAAKSVRRRQWNQAIGPFRNVTVSTVDFSYSFSASPGAADQSDALLDLQPALESAVVSVAFRTDTGIKNESIKVARAKDSIKDRLSQLQIDKFDLLPQYIESLKYKVEASPSRTFSPLLNNIQHSATPAGAVMHHFLPRALTKRIDLTEIQIEAQIATLSSRRNYMSPYVQELAFQPLPADAIELITSLLNPLTAKSEGPSLSPYHRQKLSNALNGLIQNKTLQSFENQVHYFSGSDATLLSSTIEENKQRISLTLKADRKPNYSLDIQYTEDQISEGVDLIQNLFINNVRYLGPLRDEPKPLYPLAGSTDPSDVGLRGEHTAAVLHTHKNTTISYIPCSRFSDSPESKKEKTDTELANAVNDWLNYMGVGKKFSTFDSGKLGHELKITTSGTNLEHDLTQVGVGVSQVVPILVLALLAPTESTLIFEQPELHLHPKIQSRLADFFYSMTLLGKQCIVETHSEYLINRLRYLSASEEDSKVSENTIIYFVEKPENKSIYRQIRIDELGSLDAWPDGFFDESERGTAALLRKSLEKRRSRQGRKNESNNNP